MSDLTPTYEFEEGLVTASVNGHIIASGETLEEVEREVAEALEAPAEKVDTSRKATHVETPNGLRGKILSRVAHVWGDEVTVRFENGQIHPMAVTDRTKFVTENVKTASSTPLQRLASVIDERAGVDASSLKSRYAALEDAKNEARALIASGVSETDLASLDHIILQADLEQQELQEAADHLNATEGEGFRPYKPEMQVLDSPDIGHKNDGTWLDATLEDMQAEAEQTDFNQLLDEGPSLLVAEQEDATLADAGDVRERALSHVRSKTAGVQSDKLDEYERLFVARAEEARRVELARRKQAVKKEAAAKKSHVDDAPVESLFM